jgi:hypothetical protein
LSWPRTEERPKLRPAGAAAVPPRLWPPLP